MSDWLTENYRKLLTVVRDIGEQGCEAGAIDAQKLRLTVEARREAAAKLIESGMSQREAAKELGVGRGTIQRDLTHIGPESGPERASNADQIRAQNEELKKVVVPLPVKTYSTIVIDPPWEMEKIERRVRPNQVAFDYPTMDEDELRGFPVKEMAAEDCHLFCWTTQKWLPASLRLIEEWGFKYVLLMTWHKSGGFQPHGLPQYNSEFVVYARRGSPKFRETQAFNTCFQAERREHSRKPDEFYHTVRRVTADERIDVFSREPRDGFDQYGNEKDKFAA